MGCAKINDVQDTSAAQIRRWLVTVNHVTVITTYCQPHQTILIFNVALFYFESFTAVWASSKFSKYITQNIIFLNFSDVSWFRILSAVFVTLRVGWRYVFAVAHITQTKPTIRVKHSHSVRAAYARYLCSRVKTECSCVCLRVSRCSVCAYRSATLLQCSRNLSESRSFTQQLKVCQ